MSHSSTGANKLPSTISEEDFCAWVGNASPGESIAYHRGFLAIDCASDPCTNATHRANLVRVARRAMHLSQQGFLHLVQRRESDWNFTYIAVARPRPLSNLGALRAVMVTAYADADEATLDAGEQVRVWKSA